MFAKEEIADRIGETVMYLEDDYAVKTSQYYVKNAKNQNVISVVIGVREDGTIYRSIAMCADCDLVRAKDEEHPKYNSSFGRFLALDRLLTYLRYDNFSIERDGGATEIGWDEKEHPRRSLIRPMMILTSEFLKKDLAPTDIYQFTYVITRKLQDGTVKEYRTIRKIDVNPTSLTDKEKKIIKGLTNESVVEEISK